MESSTISLLALFSFATMAAVAAIRDSTYENSIEGVVDAHNRARAAVGVQPLAWSDPVAAAALQDGLDHSIDCELDHPANGPYGKNKAEESGDLSSVGAIDMWVNEKSSYDYNSNSCVGGECKHYTQVVWRDTTHVGCARLTCRNNQLHTFVICYYDPPGNHIGQRPY